MLQLQKQPLLLVLFCSLWGRVTLEFSHHIFGLWRGLFFGLGCFCVCDGWRLDRLDDALMGKYALRYKPKLPVEMLENGKITIELSAHGKRQKIARIYVGKVARETVNIDTNRSLHTVTPFTLKGLQIIEELP